MEHTKDPSKDNVILIGMPGVGKSTAGVILAKVLGYDFLDSDLVIQKQTKKRLSEIIAAEGIVLFKNTDVTPGQKALPLAGGSKVSLFGSVSTNLRQSGGGSGSGQSNEGEYLTTEQVFTQAGFKVNNTLYSMYERANSRSEIGMESYTEDVTSSYKDYSDAAIIFISRAAGGENYDAYLGNGSGAMSPSPAEGSL